MSIKRGQSTLSAAASRLLACVAWFGVLLQFWLRSGSFATAVLREILADRSAAQEAVVVDADDV